MHVCAHCAATAARLTGALREIVRLKAVIDQLELELEETNDAFWIIAQDVRLDVVHVEVADDFVSQIFPNDETERKAVRA